MKQERDKLKAEILRSENWPVSKDTLINKYTKIFKKTVYSIPLEKLRSIKQHVEESLTFVYSK